MKTKSDYPPDEPRATASFYVATFKIVLATSGSETGTGLHRLPSLYLTGGSASKMTAVVVFIPDGLTLLPPRHDASKQVTYLYYRQEAYAAVLDLLARTGNVECSFYAGDGGSPWGRLVGVTMKRVINS
ncbi:MAG: hypothetical protein NTV46_20200 [Verrucomicrobia bacterium]|nr:hypothetical protein [Verrucomicrobiota bacterium]